MPEKTSEIMVSLGEIISKSIPENFGFGLIIFEFNNPSRTNYISNANREDMGKAMFETAYRLKENPQPGDNAFKPITNINYLEKANEYIKACNCFGLVNAMEGGHLELNSLLVDFIKYLKTN